VCVSIAERCSHVMSCHSLPVFGRERSNVTTGMNPIWR